MLLKRNSLRLIFANFCFIYSISLSFAQSNEGRDFWFAFMEHFDVGVNTKVVMITSKHNTSGVVSIPHRGWNQSFSVTANNVQVINLPSYTETLGSEKLDDTGIRVTSQLPVSVYIHQYHSMRSEAAVVLPRPSIGNEYYVMAFQGYFGQGQVYPSEFIVVGTQDETTIDITVSDNTRSGKAPGTTFSIQLNAGETYQIQAATADDDLTGSYLIGDKDFAVFGGSRWTEVPNGCGFRDNLLEQMYAVSTWGRQFVTVPNANMAYDKFRIMAAEDNTAVEVVEGIITRNFIINAGEFVEYNGSIASYIRGDKPILVAQYIIGNSCSGHSLGDPSMLLLNSIEQTRDTVTLFNSRFENITENYINIILSAEDIPFVTFDGQPLDAIATINTVGLNQEFAYTTLRVNEGAHTIISEGCGVIATAYGYGNVESYAYSGGASFRSINANPIPEGGCLNDTIFFDTGLSPVRYTFQWDLGDGNTSTEASFMHFYPNLGTYPVELILTDECLNITDTLSRDLRITLRQAVDAVPDMQICAGESFVLGATDLTSARFEWTGPNQFFAEEQFPKINNATSAMTGNYDVIGIISGCATFPATTFVEVLANPQPDLGPDTVVCTRDFNVSLDAGSFTSYLWQNNSRQQVLNLDGGGLFSVTVTDEFGCMGSDEVELREVCPTQIYVPNAFSPNDDGINDGFRIYGTDIINMELTVFSRWGEQVFKGINQEDAWDGEFKGEPLPQGVFVWQLYVEGYLKDGSMYSEVMSGAVTLVR